MALEKKMMCTRWIWTLVALQFAAVSVSGQWTLLGYILGDNDLECAAIPNMQDMAKSLLGAASGSIDVFLNVDRQTGVCSGGSQGVDLPSSSWSTDRDLLLQPGGRWSMLRDYGEVNQASASGLAAFIQRGLARFPPSPTRKYMFLIWDHGSAFEGSGLDMSCVAQTSISGTTSTKACGWLMMNNILDGLQAGLSGSGLAKFDLVAFDACLMGNWEVASTLAPVTNLLLLSEQLVPSSGLNYSSLAYMASTPTPSAELVAARWSQDYISSCTTAWGTGCIIATVNTGAQLASLTSALGSLATSWLADSTAQPDLTAILMQAGLLSQRVSKDFDAVVDLGDFLAQVKTALLNSAPSVLEAQQLHATRLSLISDASTALGSTIASYSAANAPRLTGISIFWPRTSSEVTQTSPFLSPLGQVVIPISQWVTLANSVLTLGSQIRAPYQAAMAAAAPFLPTPSWVGNQMTLTGTVPSPVLVAGDLQVGVMPDATLSAGLPGGLPMRVLRAIPATVSNDRRTITATWDGKLFGLNQAIQDPITGAIVTSRAPLYTEETVVRDSANTLVSRTLHATVAYASTCNAKVATFRAATLKIFTTYPPSGGKPTTTFNLFASSTIGNFGPAGTAGSIRVDSTLSQQFNSTLENADPLLQRVVGTLGFVPKETSVDIQHLLDSSQGTPSIRRSRKALSTDPPADSPLSAEQLFTAWMLHNGKALERAKQSAAGGGGRASGRMLEADSVGIGYNDLGGSGGDGQQQAGSKGPASLSQYFEGGTFAEVERERGGYIIPIYFTSYRMDSVGAGGGAVVYARTFAESTCFKWGQQYSGNLTLVEDTMNAWSGSFGLRSSLNKGWAARMSAVDVGGSLVQFDMVSAAGSGTKTNNSFVAARRTTLSGCTCMAQTTMYGTNGSVTTFSGCALLKGWSAPVCQVVAGSCKAAPVGTVSYDICEPLTTLSGCKCSGSWYPSASRFFANGTRADVTRYGTCAPRDSLHPTASWCQVDATTCPSFARAHGSADLSWDYCTVATASGCECTNAWMDAAGNKYNGNCAIQNDRPSNTITSWCPTNQESGNCPVAWDSCIPAGGRSVDSNGLIAQCVLPSKVTSPASISPSIALTLPAGTLLMNDCINYNGRNPGTTALPWCFSNPTGAAASSPTATSLVTASCIPMGCTGALLAACPPTRNTSNAVAECFRHLCTARARGATFKTSVCPNDTPAALAQANSTFWSVYTATINATDGRNPWLVSFLPEGPPTAREYCTARFGAPCGALIAAYCPLSVSQTSTGGYTFTANSRACDNQCLMGAGLVMDRIKLGGGLGGEGCADAAAVLPMLLRIQAWLDTACGVEPSNLVYTQLTSEYVKPEICPRPSNNVSNYLTGPRGVISSLVETVALAGDVGVPPINTLAASNLDLSIQAAVVKGVQTVLGNQSIAYSAGQTCVWTITPGDVTARYIRLQIVFLSTEASYDVLRVWSADGGLWSLSGSLPPQTVTVDTPTPNTKITASLPGANTVIDTDSAAFVISFASDLTIQNTGFLLTYKAQSTPFLAVPTCSGVERLVTIFTSLTSAAAAASWALVSANAVCPNPGSSIALLGLTADTVAPIVYSTGGPSPNAQNGPAGAALYGAFSAGALPLTKNRERTLFACLAPGSYKLVRFDAFGTGAWASASVGVYTVDSALLPFTSTTSNGNGTQGSSTTASPIYEMCDGFVVPARPADVVDAPATRAQGPGSFVYSITLGGVTPADFKAGYQIVRLTSALAMGGGVPITRVTLVSTTSGPTAPTLTVSGRRSAMQQPNQLNHQETDSVLLPESGVQLPWQEDGMASHPVISRSLRRRLQASSTIAVVQVIGFFDWITANNSLTALDTAMRAGGFQTTAKGLGVGLTSAQGGILGNITGVTPPAVYEPLVPAGPEDSGGGKGMSMTLIIAITCGVVGLAVLAVLGFVVYKRVTNREHKHRIKEFSEDLMTNNQAFVGEPCQAYTPAPATPGSGDENPDIRSAKTSFLGIGKSGSLVHTLSSMKASWAKNGPLSKANSLSRPGSLIAAVPGGQTGLEPSPMAADRKSSNRIVPVAPAASLLAPQTSLPAPATFIRAGSLRPTASDNIDTFRPQTSMRKLNATYSLKERTSSSGGALILGPQGSLILGGRSSGGGYTPPNAITSESGAAPVFKLSDNVSSSNGSVIEPSNSGVPLLLPSQGSVPIPEVDESLFQQPTPQMRAGMLPSLHHSTSMGTSRGLMPLARSLNHSSSLQQVARSLQPSNSLRRDIP